MLSIVLHLMFSLEQLGLHVLGRHSWPSNINTVRVLFHCVICILMRNLLTLECLLLSTVNSDHPILHTIIGRPVDKSSYFYYYFILCVYEQNK